MTQRAVLCYQAAQQAAAVEAEQRLTARLRAAETACSAAQDAERAARGHAGAVEAASAAAREAASSAAGEAAEARQRCELERRRCASAAGLRLQNTALLATVSCNILCKLCTWTPCRAATLAVERDSLEERLASVQRQADIRVRELEAAARVYQEKAYVAQEDVRSLAAELQQQQVDCHPAFPCHHSPGVLIIVQRLIGSVCSCRMQLRKSQPSPRNHRPSQMVHGKGLPQPSHRLWSRLQPHQRRIRFQVSCKTACSCHGLLRNAPSWHGCSCCLHSTALVSRCGMCHDTLTCLRAAPDELDLMLRTLGSSSAGMLLHGRASDDGPAHVNTSRLAALESQVGFCKLQHASAYRKSIPSSR